METIKQALKDKNYTVKDADLQRYLSDLGVQESDLDDGLVEQIVEDLIKSQSKTETALAKSNGNKPAKRKGEAIAPPKQEDAEPEVLSSAVNEHARSLQQYLGSAENAIATMNRAAVHFLGDRLEFHSQDFDRQVRAKVEKVNASRPRLDFDDVERVVLDTMPAGFADYWEQAKTG